LKKEQTMSVTRIATIGLASLVLVGITVSAQAPLQTAELVKRGLGPTDFPRITKLADNVYAYEEVHVAGEITTNNLIVVTSEGVLVADGQGTPEKTARLVAEIAKLTPQPIRYVVVASEHGDHTGGNVSFPKNATFIASPYSQTTLQRASERPARDGGPSQVVVPTEAVADKRVLKLGGTEIQILMLGRSHTGGDLVVYLPAQKILFMSETYLHRMFPSLASGYPTEWVAAVKKAQAMDVNVYVPGHGFVDSPAILKAELDTYRRALETIIAEGKRLHDGGVSEKDAEMQARFGEFDTWSIRDMMAPRAIARVYTELDGQLK
jgi:glyoxylase-like metal-dependent hydrolase (beta-lactamase superfamily II)